MKLIHISDLHIGRRVNGFSMLEDQRYILNEIAGLVSREMPCALIIAGDIFDKEIPNGEEIALFREFLEKTASFGAEVFVIRGKHDTAESIESSLPQDAEKKGIHAQISIDGKIRSYPLYDEYGQIDVFLLPHIDPEAANKAFPGCGAKSYNDAVKAAVSHMTLRPLDRSVLVAHQFVIGGARSNSERTAPRGEGIVSSTVFAKFDYVALGHLHVSQNIGESRIRYCGAPLKYSFAEAGRDKTVTIAEMKRKGDLLIRTVPLVPLRDMREIRGTFAELTSKANYEGKKTDDYIHIILTDKDEIDGAGEKLSGIYENLMVLDYAGAEQPNVSAKEDPDERLEDYLGGEDIDRMDDGQRMIAASVISKILKEEEK
ncbi:MAG: exonuclease SbcCD subunit D [Eubacterium sp.]|jgi:exonuclease SbcD